MCLDVLHRLGLRSLQVVGLRGDRVDQRQEPTGDGQDGLRHLLLFAPDTTPWNEIAADWNNTIYVPSRAGEGLNEFEFTEIIDAIGNSI